MARPYSFAATPPPGGRLTAILIVLGLLMAATPPRAHAQATADASHAQAMPPDSPPPSGEVMAPGADITKSGAATAAAAVGKAHPDVSADANPSSGAAAMAPAALAAQPQASPTNGSFMSFGSTQKGPVNIQSDGLDLDYKNNWVLFHGHVHAVQAGGVLTSDTLRVKYGKDFSEVQQMFADGNVRITQGTRWATSDHAVLDQAVHTVTLTGNPVVHDGDDRVVGQKIVFNMITGKSEVTGGAKAWFFPRDSKNPNNSGTTVGKAD
jgi:lipopolysaccharide export system protein LptA